MVARAQPADRERLGVVVVVAVGRLSAAGLARSALQATGGDRSLHGGAGGSLLLGTHFHAALTVP